VSLIAALGINSEARKAKVDYFYHLRFFFDQNVVEFDVSMRYPVGMEVVDALHNLFEKSATHLLLNYAVCTMSLHVVVHTYTVHEVGHYAYLLWRFY
jgi:hypothetical protein